MNDAWRDPANYNRRGRCLQSDCKATMVSAYWGSWCLEHNISRMEHLNENFAKLERDFDEGKK